MSEQPETSKEQAQIQTSPTQINVVETPILKTPLNEEKSKKRDTETTTPISGPSEQPGIKRKILNPLSEEEFVEETIYSQRREGLDNQQTFTISGTSTNS